MAERRISPPRAYKRAWAVNARSKSTSRRARRARAKMARIAARMGVRQ